MKLAESIVQGCCYTRANALLQNTNTIAHAHNQQSSMRIFTTE